MGRLKNESVRQDLRARVPLVNTAPVIVLSRYKVFFAAGKDMDAMSQRPFLEIF